QEQWPRRTTSEIPLLLFLLHRADAVGIDEAAFALGGAGGLHFHDYRGQVGGVRADAARQRIAPQRAEADHLLARRLARVEAEAVVIDHDQRAGALHHRALAREVELGDRD